MWLCRCGCGNVTSVWTKYLLNGSATSCPLCEDEIWLKEPQELEEIQEEITVSEYCDRWLMKQQNVLKPSTYQRYCYTVDNHIKPVLGVYRPSQLSKDKVDHLVAEKKETLSVSTVRTTLSILHTLLEYIEEEAPGQLPDFRIEYPRHEKKKLDTGDQIKILQSLTADMDTFKLGVFLALMTGMSVGEICALRWKDISFLWRKITVTNNLHVVKIKEGSSKKKELKMEPAKCSPEEQSIQMTRMTSAYCKKFLPEDKDTYILTGTGEPMPPWTVNYRFKKLMVECGMQVHFDDLHDGFPAADADMGFDDEILNDILKKNLERCIPIPQEEAERFLERYCPEALQKPMSVPISDIAHDMGLEIIQGNRITNDFSIFGEIYFTNSKATVYYLFKISKTTIDVHRGDILVDAYTFWERNLGCVKNTIAHEVYHWYKHRMYAAIKYILVLVDKGIEKCKIALTLNICSNIM